MACHPLTPAVRVASARRRSTVLGGLGSIALPGVALLVVLFGAAVMTTRGVGGGEDAEPSATGPTPTTATTATTPATATTATTALTAPARTVARDPIEGPDVAMQPMDRDAFAAEPPVVESLSPLSVLRITARYFEPSAHGWIEQCTLSSCANPFPVAFDEYGSARIQYLVRDTITAADGTLSTCRANEPPCAVRMQTGEDAAFLTTVFGGPAPAPRRVSVSAQGRIADETAVTVTARGFTPGRRVHATLCAAPDTAGTRRCGAPSPIASFTIDADGTGRTSLVVRRGHVGSERATCDRDTPCGIVVKEAESSVLPAPVVTIAFAADAPARYEAFRLATGIALAGILVAVAFFLLRRTDWRKPTEADTPDLDRAVLSDP
jgi:Neocarzinostatin family